MESKWVTRALGNEEKGDSKKAKELKTEKSSIVAKPEITTDVTLPGPRKSISEPPVKTMAAEEEEDEKVVYIPRKSIQVEKEIILPEAIETTATEISAVKPDTLISSNEAEPLVASEVGEECLLDEPDAEKAESPLDLIGTDTESQLKGLEAEPNSPSAAPEAVADNSLETLEAELKTPFEVPDVEPNSPLDPAETESNMQLEAPPEEPKSPLDAMEVAPDSPLEVQISDEVEAEVEDQLEIKADEVTIENIEDEDGSGIESPPEPEAEVIDSNLLDTDHLKPILDDTTNVSNDDIADEIEYNGSPNANNFNGLGTFQTENIYPNNSDNQEITATNEESNEDGINNADLHNNNQDCETAKQAG